jgi:hypothetical protein
MGGRASRRVVDTPGKDGASAPLEEIEVVDPTHPLFGRRFPLVTTSSTLTGPGFAWVLHRGDMQLRLPLAATSLAATRAEAPRVSTKLTVEGITELLGLVALARSIRQREVAEVPCPSRPAMSGAACRPRSAPPSPPTSPPSSRR